MLKRGPAAWNRRDSKYVKHVLMYSSPGESYYRETSTTAVHMAYNSAAQPSWIRNCDHCSSSWVINNCDTQYRRFEEPKSTTIAASTAAHTVGPTQNTAK